MIKGRYVTAEEKISEPERRTRETVQNERQEKQEKCDDSIRELWDKFK